MHVRVDGAPEKITDCIEKRTLVLNDSFTGTVDLKITHLYYFGKWPLDLHSTHDKNTLANYKLLLDLILEWTITEANHCSNHKSLVHCSAGFGRTGTTIALIHLIANLWA
jgi:protein tyrosine phosphatase